MTPSLPPLPPHRVDRLRAWLDGAGLPCAVLIGADHVNHLTGYHRYLTGPSAVVVGADGARTLVVWCDEAPLAREVADADEVVGYGERGFGIDLDPVAGLVAALAAVPALGEAPRYGLASEIAGAGERLAAALTGTAVDAADALSAIRMVKDWDEVEKIVAGYELCWLGQAAVAEAATPGVSEIELFTLAQSTAQVASGGPIDYVCDLLSGPNTAEVCCPIRVAGPRVVEAGDPVIADVVVRTNGYWGDTTETYAAAGNAEVEAARETLLAILDRTRAELVPGARGCDLFRRMHDRIVEAFPGGEFPHHGGHGLGLTGFEDPHVIPSDTIPLEPWMVIAIEPGVYFPGRYGVRVERAFVVTPDGGVELRDAVAAGRPWPPPSTGPR
jgi:Xaa-Pro aminopeptidase